MTDTTGSTTAIVPNRPWCQAEKRSDCEITLVEGGTGSSPVLVPDRTLCPSQVRDDNCQADIEDGMAVSPDGARIAYVLSEGRELDLTTVVTYDLSSGRVTRLQSTRSGGPFQCRTSASEGVNGRPTWSPDGTKLAFERQVIGPLRNGGCQATILVVGADGGNLVQLVPERMVALSPSWSPDGTRVAFHTATPKKGYANDEDAMTADIYSVRPDGHDLQRLTDDGRSIMARWTSDGRIIYRHLDSFADPREQPQLWIMDADGGNKTQIADNNLAALTALGCTTCFYAPVGSSGQVEAYWQPQP
jgi:Tol biopolymer transport system component